jgi:hypothetical protein
MSSSWCDWSYHILLGQLPHSFCHQCVSDHHHIWNLARHWTGPNGACSVHQLQPLLCSPTNIRHGSNPDDNRDRSHGNPACDTKVTGRVWIQGNSGHHRCVHSACPRGDDSATACQISHEEEEKTDAKSDKRGEHPDSKSKHKNSATPITTKQSKNVTRND